MPYNLPYNSRHLPSSAIVARLHQGRSGRVAPSRVSPSNHLNRFHTPTRLGVTFDDDRAVAGAGLALVATLSKQLGTFKLANELIDLGGVPGHATSGTGRPDRTVGLCLPSETGNFFPHRVPHPV